jgi:hypothetical protein
LQNSGLGNTLSSTCNERQTNVARRSSIAEHISDPCLSGQRSLVVEAYSRQRLFELVIYCFARKPLPMHFMTEFPVLRAASRS